MVFFDVIKRRITCTRRSYRRRDKRVTVHDLCHKCLDANRTPPRQKSYALQERKYTVLLKQSDGPYQTDLRHGGSGTKKNSLNLLAIIRSGLRDATNMHQQAYPKT